MPRGLLKILREESWLLDHDVGTDRSRHRGNLTTRTATERDMGAGTDAPQNAIRQKYIDFNRAAQLRILERALVATRGPGKSILKALDSFAREKHESVPSIGEIARNVGCGKTTARDTLHELASPAWELLTITPRLRSNRSHSTNSYAINWSKLLARVASDDVGPLFLVGGSTPTVGDTLQRLEGGTPTVGGPPITAH